MRTPTIRWNPRAAMHRAACLGLLALLLALPALAHAHGHRSIDLSRLVVVGDSISAGHQNSSLLGSQQIHGYASLVAQQAGVELPLPLISEPGFPAALTLVDPGPPPVIEPKSELYGTRIDPSVQPFNLSVPGARVQDALYRHDSSPFHGPYEPIYLGLSNLVLGPARNADGTPMSEVDWAEALQPTAIFVWLGSNDVLWSAIFADGRFTTAEDTFRQAYHALMERLAATGATLVVANIPDVSTLPYLTSAETVEAISGVPMAVLGLQPGDYVTPTAWEALGAGLVPLPDDLDGPYALDVVVRADEIVAMQEATAAFNTIIAEEAAAHHAPVVDTNALLNYVDTFGLWVDGRHLTTDFLGGVFTLDGIHPTNTAHAVIANAFIRVLNQRFRAHIRPVSVKAVMADDPLVFVPAMEGHRASFHSIGGRAMNNIDGGR